MYEADIFGLVFLGDLATIKCRPLINIIASSFNVPVAVLVVKDISKNMAQGGKKDDTFILEVFKPYLKQYNEKKIRTDMVLFDAASNVHKARQIISVSYPWITVLQGDVHVLSLFFLTLQNSQL